METLVSKYFKFIPLLTMLYAIVTFSVNTNILVEYKIFNPFVALLLIVTTPFTLTMARKLKRQK